MIFSIIPTAVGDLIFANIPTVVGILKSHLKIFPIVFICYYIPVYYTMFTINANEK